MESSIIDYRIRIKPSIKLIDFIVSLEDENVMPLNILKIIQAHSSYEIKREILDTSTINLKDINDEQLKFLNDELNEKLIDLNFDNDDIKNVGSGIKTEDKNDSDSKSKSDQEDDLDEDEEDDSSEDKNELLLEINDLKWIKQIADEKRKKQFDIDYLHELLENCELILPKNEIIPRNLKLEERCKKLRAEQNSKIYREMTKNVDTVRKEEPEDTIGSQIKAINRQLIAILQFVFSVVAGFAFGFIGVKLIVGNLDFGFRLLLGVMCALTIALAEIYFLAKKLNEYEDLISSPLPT